MNKYIKFFVSSCFILVFVLGSTSCVSKSDYDKLMEDYHRLEEELTTQKTEMKLMEEKIVETTTDIENMMYYLAYERVSVMWEMGELYEVDAAVILENILVDQGNDKLLNLWDWYQASTTEKEMDERNYLFTESYYREYDKLMNEIAEKYALWTYSQF